MKRKDLVAEVARRVNANQKDVKTVLDTIGEVIKENIHDEDGISPFNGVTFYSQEKPARNGVNPATGEPIVISARVVPKARFGKAFKEAASEE